MKTGLHSGPLRIIKHQLIPGLSLLASTLVLWAVFCPAVSADDELINWPGIISRKEAQLERMNKALETLSASLPQRFKRVHENLLRLEAQLDTGIWFYYGSVETLRELQDLLRGIESIENRVEVQINPLKRHLRALDRYKKLAAESIEEIDNQKQVFSAVLPAELDKKIKVYSRELDRIESNATQLHKLVLGALKPALAFQDRLKREKETFRREFERRLTPHFIDPAPHYFSPDGWRSAWKNVKDWRDRFDFSTLGFGHLAAASTWVEILFTALVLSIIFAILSRAVLAGIGRRLPAHDISRLFFPACLWGAVTFGLIAATAGKDLPQPWVFDTLAAVFFTRGLMSLSWSLRGLVHPSVAWHSNILSAPWVVFTAGMIFMDLPWPPQAVIPLWAVLLSGAFIYYSRRNRQDPPLLEWWIIRVFLWIYPLAAFIAPAGWGNLSVLIVLVAFIIVLDVHISYAISSNMAGLRKTPDGPPGGLFIRCLAIGLRFPLVFLTIFYISLAMAVDFIGGISLLYHVIDLKIGWDKLSFTFARIPLIVVFFFITRSLVELAHEAIVHLPQKTNAVKEGEVLSLKTISSYAIWFVFIMSSLYAMGFSLHSLAIIGGGLSVGLGFGLQNIINNFVSGLILLFGRSIKPGDMIQVGDITGTVKKVTIRDTLVRTATGPSVFIPNSNLINSKFINWSHQDPRLRLDITVGVAGDSDTHLVSGLLLEAARSNPLVLDDPPPSVSFAEFGTSSLNFTLKFWIEDCNRMGLASDIRHDIKRIFSKHHIEIPFTTYDLHIRSLAESTKPIEKSE